ncbi:hypothetical protein [Selenomonas massiliensis]|uniref:hypothetical protein n=1 Tax=Selenomonas massiliensis TaxID=2058293 RepID=UPI000D0F3E23|nr:hypothetical protein [Selenomonas massiliensis]
MKIMICLLAAGLLVLPAWGVSAEKKEIHTVMTAEEGSPAAQAPPQETATHAEAEEAALDEEMDELGEEAAGSHDAATPPPAQRHAAATALPAAKEPAPQDGGHGIGIAPVTSDDAAYGAATAIEPVTLADGDWVFIEGDERRGWFFDRSRMRRNSDGTISYWQLILYNDFGKAQFVRAMHDEAYDGLAYTLQRRVLNTKKNTIRTYEILAYDNANALITDGDRDGHAAEIHPNTMAAKERDAVKKAAKKIKNKQHTS